jgi:hypothetical protein
MNHASSSYTHAHTQTNTRPHKHRHKAVHGVPTHRHASTYKLVSVQFRARRRSLPAKLFLYTRGSIPLKNSTAQPSLAPIFTATLQELVTWTFGGNVLEVSCMRVRTTSNGLVKSVASTPAHMPAPKCCTCTRTPQVHEHQPRAKNTMCEWRGVPIRTQQVPCLQQKPNCTLVLEVHIHVLHVFRYTQRRIRYRPVKILNAM